MSSETTLSRRLSGVDYPPVPDGRTTADLDMFWASYEHTLRRYAGYLLDLRGIPDGRADIDDITSDVYIDLRERWPTVRFPVAFSRSRARVAVFEALHDEMHRSRPIGGEDDQDDDLDIVDDDPNPEDVVLDRQVEEALNAALPRALDGLPSKQRAAVMLTTSGKYSRRQAAREIGAAPGTISSHRARGLTKLREVLLPFVIVIIIIERMISGICAAYGLPAWPIAACLGLQLLNVVRVLVSTRRTGKAPVPISRR